MTRPPRESESDFLSRWSRRKQDARREPEEEPAEPAAAPAPEQPEKTEAEILEKLGLPDPDKLGPSSDFKAFMAETVPDWLRRRALRRLWASNPVLANLDRLVDYDDDYTDAATVVANLQSAYKVGRGYADRLLGDASAEREDASAPEPESPPPETSDAPETAEPEHPDPEAQDAGDTEPAAPAAEDLAAETVAAPLPADPPAPRRRRMRFDFDAS